MPSIFSHAISALVISEVTRQKYSLRFGLLAIFCAIIPDIDVIAFWCGVPYESMLAHRGLTHSICFALVLAIILVFVFFRENQLISKNNMMLISFFFICTVSHGVLDAMTSGGKGVAFLLPFNNERFFFPSRPIHVSPIGLRFFSERGLMAIRSEFLLIWMPSALVVIVLRLIRWCKKDTIRLMRTDI